MNPSFLAYQWAMMRASISLLMGVPHRPKTKRDPEDDLASTEFPRSDIVEEAEDAQRNVSKINQGDI